MQSKDSDFCHYSGSLDEKIYEIALMISDGKVSEKQLEYAKEMVLSNI